LRIRLGASRWTLARTRSLNLEILVPRLLVGLPVLFNLWFLRAETIVVQNPNDSHLHFAMVRWARDQILEGHLIPVDGWFPYLGLGAAQFRHYQILPHILTAYASLVVSADTAYFWSLYLLLATWPISVYLGARLLDWDRWTAVGAALVAPLLVSASNYGFEQRSYTWFGLGLWAQLWGMVLLPIALGFTWRALRGKGSYVLAAFAVAVTVACHFITGYLALLAIGLWSVISPSQLVPRVRRGILIGLGALAAIAWALIPIFQDGPWLLNSEYGRGTTFGNSFGAKQVLGWLFTGQIYDLGRLPIVTALVGVGLVVCVVRFGRDERARAVVVLWLVSLLLFFGRTTFGALIDLLPASHSLPFHRFIYGLHMAGILLAGIGIGAAGRGLVMASRRFLPRLQPRLRPVLAGSAAVILAAFALYPAWTEVAAGDNATIQARSGQQVWESLNGADLQVLLDSVRALGGGRVYAGGRWAWGDSYRIGYVPVYSVLANEDFDAVGLKNRVNSLMSDVEMLFDDRIAAEYDLLNIRYLILPADHPPPIEAKFLAQQGWHKLYQMDTSGYLEVVDTTWPPVVEDEGNIATNAIPFLGSAALARRQYPTVAFAGRAAADPSLAPGAVAEGPAGQVLDQESSPADGVFKGEIVANRRAAVLLKSSYDPHWRVSVDGDDRPTDMIAPALIGTTVSPGPHTIAFHYVPDREYPLLFALALLGLGGLWAGPRLANRWRITLSIRPTPPPPGQKARQ
jgi:hypothetical protein